MEPLRAITQANQQSRRPYNYAARYSYRPPLSPNISPELAEGLGGPGRRKTYVFHLRKGVKFNHGNAT